MEWNGITSALHPRTISGVEGWKDKEGRMKGLKKDERKKEERKEGRGKGSRFDPIRRAGPAAKQAISTR
jgi:hypothetical protein